MTHRRRADGSAHVELLHDPVVTERRPAACRKTWAPKPECAAQGFVLQPNADSVRRCGRVTPRNAVRNAVLRSRVGTARSLRTQAHAALCVRLLPSAGAR